EVDRLNVVRRAEQARELQVRTEARIRPAAETVAVLGSEPGIHTERQSWLNAVETRAIHDERFSSETPDHPDRRWSERRAEVTEATARTEVDARVLEPAELGV